MSQWRRALRDALVVARFELAESLRSRRVLIFLTLYVASAIASTALFTEVLQKVEEELAQQLLVARTGAPGSLTRAVMESPELLRVLSRLTRDPELAQQLLQRPPVALLYHWIALTFSPLFVMLTSSEAISRELSTGSLRYALFRTDRASWAVGKLVGHTALLVLGLVAGAVASWGTGWVQLASFEAGPTAAWLLRYAGSAFFFAFAHIGLALGVSQLCRSLPWSRALGLFAITITYGLSAWLSSDAAQDAAPVFAETLRQLLPPAHRLDLWRLDLAAVARSAAALTALGLAYFSIGHLRFARRDA